MASEWRGLFGRAAPALAGSWQRAPRLALKGEALLRGRVTLDDIAPLVDHGKMPGGCAVLGSGRRSWTSAPIAGPLARALPKSTAYVNNAGMYVPALAEVCLAAVEELGWPTTCNVYLSAPGMEVSVPPHTDRQDVFVLQTAGTKRWTVYRPTPLGAEGTDPLRRGKDGDELPREQLGEPLLDVTLAPGDALYVPLGFPHETSTVSSAPGVDKGEASVHVTLNLDSLIWGLSYRLLWAASLRAARLATGVPDPADEAPASPQPEGTAWATYASLQAPLNFGFLQHRPPLSFLQQQSEAKGMGRVVAPASAVGHATGEDLRERARRWGAPTEEVDLVGDEHVAGALAMLDEHRQELLRLHTRMYADVLLDLSGLPPIEREMGHWQVLQEQMSILRRGMGWEE